MASSTYEVVVLGANFGGVNMTHYLHRQIFPVLKRLDPSLKFHVTVVSPNSHFFFKVAAPRALTKADAILIDRIFKLLDEGFEQYGEANTFLQGKAVSLGRSNGKGIIEIEKVGSGKQALKYDALFICTGTTTTSPLWTLHDDHESSVEALKGMHSLLPRIKSALIAGAGPIGVETAGEIAFAHPTVKTTLVAGGEILEKKNLGSSTVSKATQQLADAKVELLTNVRVKDTALTASGTTVQLSDGSSKTVDLFIDARGPTKINNEFIPSGWLDQTGRVKSDKVLQAMGIC